MSSHVYLIEQFVAKLEITKLDSVAVRVIEL